MLSHQQKGTHQHSVLNLGQSTSSRVSIWERQLDAVEFFEHQKNRQIKINAAVREPSLAEQHWMLDAENCRTSMEISGQTPVDLSTCGGISLPKKKQNKIDD